MDNISNTIKMLRKEKKVSQEEMVKELGITVQTLSRIENGKGKVHTEMLEKMCKIFGVSMVDFMQIAGGVESADQIIKPVLIYGYVNDLSKKTSIKWSKEGKPESQPIGSLNMSTQLSDANCYAMIVNDNKVDPIETGWVIVVSPYAEIQNRDFVLVEINGEAILRRITINDNNTFALQVTKSFQRPTTYAPKDIVIMHKVVAFVSPFTNYITLD